MSALAAAVGRHRRFFGGVATLGSYKPQEIADGLWVSDRGSALLNHSWIIRHSSFLCNESSGDRIGLPLDI
jgi:hypothetical protein